jgi:hypothetical protein
MQATARRSQEHPIQPLEPGAARLASEDAELMAVGRGSQVPARRCRHADQLAALQTHERRETGGRASRDRRGTACPGANRVSDPHGVTTHIEGEPPVAEFEPNRSSTEGMHLSPGEKHPGLEEEEAESRRHNEHQIENRVAIDLIPVFILGTRGVPDRRSRTRQVWHRTRTAHAKQSVRSGSGSGGCGRFVKSKSYERSVASRSRSVNRESPQLVSMKRRTLENSPI